MGIADIFFEVAVTQLGGHSWTGILGICPQSDLLDVRQWWDPTSEGAEAGYRGTVPTLAFK